MQTVIIVNKDKILKLPDNVLLDLEVKTTSYVSASFSVHLNFNSPARYCSGSLEVAMVTYGSS